MIQKGNTKYLYNLSNLDKPLSYYSCKLNLAMTTIRLTNMGVRGCNPRFSSLTFVFACHYWAFVNYNLTRFLPHTPPLIFFLYCSKKPSSMNSSLVFMFLDLRTPFTSSSTCPLIGVSSSLTFFIFLCCCPHSILPSRYESPPLLNSPLMLGRFFS